MPTREQRIEKRVRHDLSFLTPAELDEAVRVAQMTPAERDTHFEARRRAKTGGA